MYKYTIIYLFIILSTTESTNLPFKELKTILTKKDLQDWLYNETAQHSSKNKYCRLCCINVGAETIGKKCGSHTMCKYPGNQTGPACHGYIQIGFTHNEQQVILDAHNTLRNKVASGEEIRGQPGPQPQAANMRALEWNSELAMVAERWAAQCIYSNDVCRDLERFPVGQNIAHGNVATHNELSFIKEWFDEVVHFDHAEVKNFKLPAKGDHTASKYTQLVWADTYQIGCARAIFQQSQGSSVIYREHFICNYGPTGNIPNQPVYVVGGPCSSCHESTSCTLEYPALCSGEVINRIVEEKNVRVKHSGSKGTIQCTLLLIESNLFLVSYILYYCIYFY